MMHVRNLDKYYNKGKSNELHVLNSIELEFSDKGLVALFGKSGSGKTTLLNCLGGLDGFDSGNYSVDGIDSKHARKFNEYRRKNIGFIFQDFSLIDELTVEENILTALAIAGDDATIEKVNVALITVGMERYNKRIVSTLSGGQKQRIAIARAIVINPCLILADEPTGNLDKENTIKVLEILKSISNETLVLLVSHEREIVEQYADRIIEIEQARVVSDTQNKITLLGSTINPVSQIESKNFTTNGIALNLYYSADSNDIVRLNIAIDGDSVYVHCEGKELIQTHEQYDIFKSVISKSKDNPACLPANMPKNECQQSFRRQLLDSRGSIKKVKKKVNISLKSKMQKTTAIVMALTAILIAITMSLFDGGDKNRYP